MQKLINTVLLVGLLGNLAFTVFVNVEFDRSVRDFKNALEGPAQIPGKGLEYYDMSSPEASLRSMKEVVNSFDVRAVVDLLKLNMRSESSPLADYILQNDAQLTVEKTHVIKDSSVDGAEGTVLAFVRVIDSGVETHDVQAFQKKEGLFMPTTFSLWEWKKDDWTDEDEYLDQLHKSWKTKGQLP